MRTSLLLLVAMLSHAQAIFLRKDYSITGLSRQEMVHDIHKLRELGGEMKGLVNKWNDKK